MSEQFPEGSPRRGRRDPELEEYLESADELETSPGAELVHRGDQVMARVTLQHPTEVGDGWFTYGATTSVQPDESGEDAGTRLYDYITEQVYSLVDGVTDTVQNAAAEQEAARREAVRTRRNPRAINPR